jgi:hypothetical protein
LRTGFAVQQIAWPALLLQERLALCATPLEAFGKRRFCFFALSTDLIVGYVVTNADAAFKLPH